MKVTWLGQAGLLLQKDDFTIMIDPYLSDSVERVNPQYYRRHPVDETFFDIKPDVLLFTHNHRDHYDPETVARLLAPHSNITVLAPFSVWREVNKFGEGNNYVMFNRHTTWTQGNIEFAAVKAEHSDLNAIGVIIDDGTRKFYITGDTLFNEEIFADVPKDIFAIFLPVNGQGNNMNMTDANRFCEKINPKVAVPVHCGMFDSIDMNLFAYKNKVVPEIYKEVGLPE